MAQPTNTIDTYDIVGIREQLAEKITMISPEETPLVSKSGTKAADNTYHEWQTDTLRAAAANAHIEGDTTTASARASTTRLGNYTQILKDSAIASGTQEAVNKAGRGDELVREVMKIGKELKLDLERHLFQNQARVAGNSSTARQMAALQSWLNTNTYHGSGGSAATGDGTDARTTGTNRAFTQAMVDTAMQGAWNSGGKPDVIYASPTKVGEIAGFTGSNNQRNTVDSREVSFAVDVYMTSFGTVEIQPSRYAGDNAVYGLESPMWKIATLRDWQTKALPADGDFEKEQVLGEKSLEACNEASSFGIFDLT